MTRPLHPFPARMAPDIVLDKLRHCGPREVVLDPMAGSGTVVRVAADMGLRVYGCDVDPLAVLMTRVGCSNIDPTRLVDCGAIISRAAEGLAERKLPLPWIDKCPETSAYIRYWFADEQIKSLRALAWLIHGEARGSLLDCLRIAISKLIVTKHKGASLAWDVSHSRPHRVRDHNDFDVPREFERACQDVARYLLSRTPNAKPAKVRRDDARSLFSVESRSIDAIVTSPPYLNAIDYMRGHRMALVWLGYQIPALRALRSSAVGSEAGNQRNETIAGHAILDALGSVRKMPPRLQRMALRYSVDLVRIMQACERVLKKNGAMHLVVGDSRVQGIRLANSSGIIAAAELTGFHLVERRLRRIPTGRRYLPAGREQQTALARRMMTEHVLSFAR